MINYLVGDATKPQVDGNKIIAHVCNDSGGFGAGFVVALAKRWPKVKESYLGWYNKKYYIPIHKLCTGRAPISFALGNVQLVEVEPEEDVVKGGIYVANMIAQVGFIGKDNEIPLKYDALTSCLTGVADLATRLISNGKFASIHMPRIGCGLSGGSWEKVENIIEKCMPHLSVVVYDFVDPNSIDTQIPWRK